MAWRPLTVIWSRRAGKGLADMPRKDADALIAKVEAQAASGLGDVIRLVGQPEHRLRHGDWRAVLVVEGDLIVVRVAHRRDVYD